MSALVHETVFEIPGMDCPSEERLIRLALQPEPGVQDLQFDLEARRLVVRHEGDSAPILARLEPLGREIDLGEILVEELSLNLDPYPRKEGVAFHADDAPPRENPFAVLAKLKPKLVKKDV